MIARKQQVSKQQRIEWLLQNQALWEGYPQNWFDKEHAIFDRMKLAKLYARSTDFEGVDIGMLIALARRVRRERFARANGWRPRHD